MSYKSRKKKRAVRRARKRKVGPVSAHKAGSRELYYARKSIPPTHTRAFRGSRPK